MNENKHRTYEQILEDDYHVILEDNRRDESIKLAAEEYRNQPTPPAKVEGVEWQSKSDEMYCWLDSRFELTFADKSLIAQFLSELSTSRTVEDAVGFAEFIGRHDTRIICDDGIWKWEYCKKLYTSSELYQLYLNNKSLTK